MKDGGSDRIRKSRNQNITYLLLTKGLSTQVIVITATAGGTIRFTLS